MTSYNTFTARQTELNKKRIKIEARHAVAKEREAKQKHALEVAKADEPLNIAAATLNAEERLIVLSERSLLVAVSSKAKSIVL